jgi:hypothetical protein
MEGFLEAVFSIKSGQSLYNMDERDVNQCMPGTGQGEARYRKYKKLSWRWSGLRPFS